MWKLSGVKTTLYLGLGEMAALGNYFLTVVYMAVYVKKTHHFLCLLIYLPAQFNRFIDQWYPYRYPLIDASMRELLTTGFMSNRGRQVIQVACRKLCPNMWTASFIAQNPHRIPGTT